MVDASIPVEEWRLIPSLGGLYAASNHGRVMRAAPAKGRRDGAGRILKLAVNSTGYLCFAPSINGVHGPSIKVHRVVAEAFIGPRPGGLVVNHKDGVRVNNHANNLEYITIAENNRHAVRVMGAGCGERNHKARLTAADVMIIRQEWAKNPRGIGRRMGARFGVSKTHVEYIVWGRRWKHLPCPACVGRKEGK